MPSPELQAILDVLRANHPIQGETIHEQREFLSNVAVDARAEDVRYEPVDAGGVPAEWVTAPESRDDRAIVYLHGGAYVLGSIETHRGLVTRLARAAGARVLSVDYRLAPEHPHPAAVDDALAAWRYVRAGGIAPEAGGFAGDSAGGGLTAAALVAARDAGDPLPAAAACMSPWLDLTLTSPSITAKAEEDPMVELERMLVPAAAAYLAGADARTPTASPLFADLAGLPPLLVQVGTAEILLDDSLGFAERARAAGVELELEVAEDHPHVWQAFADVLPEGAEAIERIGAFFRKRW